LTESRSQKPEARSQRSGFWFLVSVPVLQAAPIAAIMAFFLVIPIIVIVVVSFWDYTEYDIIPSFVFTNYTDVFGSWVTYETYFSTLRFAALTWFFTLLIGFWIAYFLVFHVRSKTWQTTLFLICTLPFLTSNVIRSIAWIPVLGRNGLVNSALIGLGVINHPLEFLLFSDFSVVLSYVHLFVLFMVVPIFNTMMRIDRSLIEAAVDAGASGWQVVRDIIIPLSKPGIAIGSIFVVTLVMGEFITVRLMSGGQSASVGLMISNQLNYLQYPAAAANAVVLLAVVLLIVAAMMRVVDIRKEL
jgi:putative spermidine/putrescine transport system permease protein